MLYFMLGLIGGLLWSIDDRLSEITKPRKAAKDCEHLDCDQFALAKWCLDCGAVKDGEDEEWLQPRLLSK